MGFNTAAGRAEIIAGIAQDEFDFVFKIYADEDIVAWLTPNGQEPDDVADLLVLGTDYTIVVNGDDGGVFTLLSAAGAGDYLTLVRNLAPTRSIEYPENGDLRPAILNADQNYQTYLVADTLTAFNKTLRLAENTQGVSAELPNPFSNSYLRWNEDATAMENDTTVPQAVIDSAASAAAALVSENAAAESAAAIGNMINTDTIATFKAFTTTPTNVYVTGYHAADDKAFGSNFFKLKGVKTTETDNGGTIQIITVDAIEYVYELQYSGAVSVKWFGAVGDGTTDDTTAINNALNFETVFMPHGTYLVSSSLVMDADGATLTGSGNNTTITRSTDFGSTLVISKPDPTTDTIYNVTLSKIRFDSTIALTSGAHVEIIEAAYFNINNLSIQNGFIGLSCAGIRASFISDIHIRSGQLYTSVQAGSKFALFKDSPRVSVYSENVETFVSNFNLTTNGADAFIEHGLHIKDADGLWFDNGHIRGASTSNCFMDDASSDQLLGVHFNNTWFDNATERCLLFDGVPTAGYSGFHNFNGCTFTDPSVHAIHINSGATIDDLTFTGCIFGWVDTQIGLRLDAGKSLNFTGCSFHSFNDSNVASSSAILIGSAVKSCNFTGGSIYDSPQIDFAINCQGGATEMLTVTGFAFKDLQASAKPIQLSNPATLKFASSGCLSNKADGYVTGNEQTGETLSITDDGVQSVNIGEILGGVLVVNLKYNQSAGGIILIETADPSGTTILSGGVSLEIATGILTGTTGTDGKFTVSITDDGTLYFENRTGVTRTAVWKIINRDIL